MKGVVDIGEFVRFLQNNNLVIAPVSRAKKNTEHLREKLLRQNLASYAEISESEVWGRITRKRAYQIAKELARESEIIKTGPALNSPEKIVVSAVKRIRAIRGIDVEIMDLINEEKARNGERSGLDFAEQEYQYHGCFTSK